MRAAMYPHRPVSEPGATQDGELDSVFPRARRQLTTAAQGTHGEKQPIADERGRDPRRSADRSADRSAGIRDQLFVRGA